MNRTSVWINGLLTMALAACGGSEAADDDGPGGGGTSGGAEVAETEPTSPPEPWEEMSHEAKQAWMFAEVLPRMTDAFQGYDAERYADFSCATCHGPNGAEEGFEMPSASLPALPPTGSPVQHAMVRTYPEGTRFMFSNVLPTMQTLLGAPDFDEATGEGFSCFSCHPHEGDEGSTLIRVDAPEPEPSDTP